MRGVNGVDMSRRAFVGAGLVATLFAACSGKQADEAATTSANNAEGTTEVVQAEEAAEALGENGQASEAPAGEETSEGAGTALVVYYSRAGENYADGGTEVIEVGHTKVMAGYIVEATGADTFEIVPQEDYPFSYSECLDRASAELADDARPEIACEMPDVTGYDTIFVGCPIWWGSEPMVVRTFLDKVDLSGKTIVPFTTHGGSGLGSVVGNLEARIAGATFLDGKAVAGTAVDGARDEVLQWVEGLGL